MHIYMEVLTLTTLIVVLLCLTMAFIVETLNMKFQRTLSNLLKILPISIFILAGLLMSL